MTAVTGKAMPYEISLPYVESWAKDSSHSPFDYLFIYHDACLGIIAENIGAGTPERMCEISRKNLASKASTCAATQPAAIAIDSRSWLTFDADATVKGVHFKYRYYVYGDAERAIQIMAWTGPVVFERYAPIFDRIAKSFKLPAKEMNSAKPVSPSLETTITPPDRRRQPL
jgi:hypothetical protein